MSASLAIALAHAVSVIELTAGYGSTDVYHLVWAHDTVMQVLTVYMDFVKKNLFAALHSVTSRFVRSRQFVQH